MGPINRSLQCVKEDGWNTEQIFHKHHAVFNTITAAGSWLTLDLLGHELYNFVRSLHIKLSCG